MKVVTKNVKAKVWAKRTWRSLISRELNLEDKGHVFAFRLMCKKKKSNTRQSSPTEEDDREKVNIADTGEAGPMEEDEVERVDNEPQTTVEEGEEEKKKKKKKKKKEKKNKMENLVVNTTEVEKVKNENRESSQFEEDEEEVEKVDNQPQSTKEEEEEEADKMANVKVKIETFCEKPEKISPFVGYFPSGFNPLKIGHKQEDTPPPLPRVEVFRHKHPKRGTRSELVVTPNGSQVNFVGTNYSGEGTAPQICQYGLAVLDKATHTLKIVPIVANKVLRLEPRVGTLKSKAADIIEREEKAQEKTEEEKAEKMADKSVDLQLMYRTNKDIRKSSSGNISVVFKSYLVSQNKKIQSLHQMQDPKSQEDWNKTLQGITINKEALENAVTATNDGRNIPPHDMSAVTPDMAYPLDKIIRKGEWDYLVDILELFQEGAEMAPDVYPSFVCSRYYKLEHIEDEEEKKRMACVLSYISHLVKFKDKHSMDGVSSAKYHKFPGILSQKFSTMFLESDSKRLSTEKNDLLISYVLVLSLFADDFRSDPSDIAKDLRMSEIALRRHYEHLGCKFVSEGSIQRQTIKKATRLATLPVPLQFPVLRRKRR
ncbi:hypothetical protein RJ640_009283, partial [Escallonia rubra]